MEHEIKFREGMLRIAVIHPDTLAAIGLKQMLQEVMPIVDVDTFLSVNDIPKDKADNYIHYFASTSAVADNVHFFYERKRKTIILSASVETQSPFAGFHHLYTSVSEKQLVKSLLALEQMAHASGKNLPPKTHNDEITQLSPREIEVMTLIVKGMINKEIASHLNIGLSTVITHRRNIMDKLNLKSVSALTIYAVTHGYIEIKDI